MSRKVLKRKWNCKKRECFF